MSKRLKDALFERTTLVGSRIKSADASGPALLLVVAFQALDIVIVFKVLFGALSDEFLSDGLVVSDVNIFQISFEHLLISIVQECLNLLFHFITLFHVACAELFSMLNFEHFECEADAVLMQELAPLLLFVESWCTELDTPPRSVVLVDGSPSIPGVRVMDHILVVICLTEGPNVIFVQTMIDKWNVGVRRVRVQILTLSVGRDKLFVSVLHGDEGRGADSATFLWHERLHTLEVVCLEHVDIIKVGVVMRVVLDALVETSEGIVEDVLVILGEK